MPTGDSKGAPCFSGVLPCPTTRARWVGVRRCLSLGTSSVLSRPEGGIIAALLQWAAGYLYHWNTGHFSESDRVSGTDSLQQDCFARGLPRPLQGSSMRKEFRTSFYVCDFEVGKIDLDVVMRQRPRRLSGRVMRQSGVVERRCVEEVVNTLLCEAQMPVPQTAVEKPLLEESTPHVVAENS